MSVDKEEISRTVLELDKEFNKRWSNGDNRGYLDAYTDDATYFEPAVKEMIVGKDKIIAWIDSIYFNEHIVRNEYLNPQVHVNGSGDFALMAYNLNTYIVDEKGTEQLYCAWNTSHGYHIDGQWRIVHSNWALTQTTTEEPALGDDSAPR
jgi:ketosteroid isomerase-like protein